MVEATGLDETAVAALLVVHARPGRSVSELAVALTLTHSGAVRVIDRCERRHLVSRSDGRDRRTRGITLTPTGVAMAERALAARRRALSLLLDTVAERDRAALGRALEAMLGHLPEGRADAWRICRVCEHRVCRGERCPVGRAADLQGAGP